MGYMRGFGDYFWFKHTWFVSQYRMFGVLQNRGYKITYSFIILGQYMGRLPVSYKAEKSLKTRAHIAYVKNPLSVGK